MQLRDRIKELRRIPANELRPNPKNWRTHPDAQQNALRGVLAEIGIANAVLARELDDGSLMLIDGHLRAETIGSEIVPVLVLDVNESEADKLLVTLDPLAAMAEEDSQKLADLFKTLQEEDDQLHKLTWPDYIIDPLISAEWKPPADDGSSPHENTQKPDLKPAGHPVYFDDEQWSIIVEAHGNNDGTLAEFLTDLCIDAG